MGKTKIVSLIVALACMAHGFKMGFDEIDNGVKEFKIPDMTEDQQIAEGYISCKDDGEQEEPIEDEDKEDVTVYRCRTLFGCQGGSLVVGGIRSGKPIYKVIRFNPSFHSTPAIMTAVRPLDSHGPSNVHFGVEVVAESHTNMKLKVWTLGSYCGLYSLYVTWRACPL